MPKFLQGNRVIISMDAEVVQDEGGEHGEIVVGPYQGPLVPTVSQPDGESQMWLYQVWLDSDREITAPESELSLE